MSEEHIYYRASGDCICHICFRTYKEHPMDMEELSYDRQPYLNVLCNGERVKL